MNNLKFERMMAYISLSITYCINIYFYSTSHSIHSTFIFGLTLLLSFGLPVLVFIIHSIEFEYLNSMLDNFKKSNDERIESYEKAMNEWDTLREYKEKYEALKIKFDELYDLQQNKTLK